MGRHGAHLGAEVGPVALGGVATGYALQLGGVATCYALQLGVVMLRAGEEAVEGIEAALPWEARVLVDARCRTSKKFACISIGRRMQGGKN